MNRFKMTQWGEEGQTSGGVTVSLSSAWLYVRRNPVWWLVFTSTERRVSAQRPSRRRGGTKAQWRRLVMIWEPAQCLQKFPLMQTAATQSRPLRAGLQPVICLTVSQRDEQAEKARDRRHGRKSLFQTDPMASVTIRRVLTYVEQMT